MTRRPSVRVATRNAVLLGWGRAPHRGRRLLVGALLVIGGVVLNRLNVSWFGLLSGTGASYVPKWEETLLTAGFTVIGVIAFVAIARILPVFPSGPASTEGRGSSRA
jgi:Ni/Fe-hydrogenase subunit HybB-like protein